LSILTPSSATYVQTTDSMLEQFVTSFTQTARILPSPKSRIHSHETISIQTKVIGFIAWLHTLASIAREELPSHANADWAGRAE